MPCSPSSLEVYDPIENEMIFYSVCALGSVAGAVLLFRLYRSTRALLLLWCSFCLAVAAMVHVRSGVLLYLCGN